MKYSIYSYELLEEINNWEVKIETQMRRSYGRQKKEGKGWKIRCGDLMGQNKEGLKIRELK
jgi:hypothetical protein